MKHMNTRLAILQFQYAAMARRADSDPRVMAKYERLIEAEYRKTRQATGLNQHLAAMGARDASPNALPGVTAKPMAV